MKRTHFYIYNAANELVDLLVESFIGLSVSALAELAYATANKHKGTVKIVRK